MVNEQIGQIKTMQPDNAVYLSAGTMLSKRYIIDGTLGSGGFCVTYTAWDKTLQIKTVIKEYMPKELLERENGTTEIVLKYSAYEPAFREGIELFLKEARILAKFSGNPDIAGVTDYFTENNTAYIVMPFREGITLGEYIKGRTLGFKQCRSLLTPLMKALAEVHREKVLHKDISPDNILVTTDRKAVLLDFGSSEAAESSDGTLVQKAPSQLKQGYAPPEQYSYGGILGPWTDVYAMAATLYQCLSGKVPAPAVDRMRRDKLESIRSLNKSVPRHASYAVMKALSLPSGDRYQDMNAFIGALFSAGAYPGYRKTAVKAAAAALILGAGIMVGVLTAGGSNRTPTLSGGDTSEAALSSMIWEPVTTGGASDATAFVAVVFEDAGLEACVRAAAGKPTGDIYSSDLSELNVLEAKGCGIVSLAGLEYCQNLSILLLTNNMIEDLAPLSGLTKLDQLDLGGNLISDISPLDGCTFISVLDLNANSVRDISVLSGLTNLTWLDLNGNNLTDVTPLGGLPKLKWLNIAGNHIADISCLADCPRIEEIAADDNDIENVDAFEGHPTLEKLQY